jgi:hypothetical protein
MLAHALQRTRMGADQRIRFLSRGTRGKADAETASVFDATARFTTSEFEGSWASQSLARATATIGLLSGSGSLARVFARTLV